MPGKLADESSTDGHKVVVCQHRVVRDVKRLIVDTL